MNAMPDNIIVNSCQYTPVYLIQDPGASQGQSYFLAQSIEEARPISDNLKSFYENSGTLENNFINVNNSHKPRILRKQEGGVVGNNLKLASFLLPKNENSNKQQQQYVVNNVILKPNVTLSSTTNTCNTVNNTINNPINNTVSTTSTTNTVPRLNIDSKIVKLKDTIFNGTTLKSVDGRRYNRVEKVSPKVKPKEILPILQSAPAKLTSVQLLKLGETYHSLNQLSDEQIKMVTQALEIFSNPDNVKPEPAYDPVTNTKFIYKVVSPRDLTLVGKNIVVTKDKKQTNEPNIEGSVKKDHIKTEFKRETTRDFIKKEPLVKDVVRKEIIVKDVIKKENILKHEVKKENVLRKNEEKLLKQKIQRELEEDQEMAEDPIDTSQPKVTRSGRKVKLPNLSIPHGVCGLHQKPKKKNTYVSCFQCALEFPSLYRLQKHYETHPTHIPVKIHSNLFHCLLAIVKSGTEGDRTNIFIQQLEQLIVKLRSLLPCMLRNSEEDGQACTVSEDVGRLLDINPGKYHLDIDALSCVKNKDGYCDHRPLPQSNDLKQDQNGTHSWITMNNEDILANTEIETEDCARINSVEKWPTVNKRVWKQKQQKSQENAKRMRLASENCDTLIEMGMDDLVVLGKPDDCPEKQGAIVEQGAEQKAENQIVIKIEADDASEQVVCANIVEEPSNNGFDQPVKATTTKSEIIENHKTLSNHAQFHSAHFDIRSSPIKPTSTIFRKFQINPELLAKYEEQIIRSIETVDKGKNSDKDIPCPTVEEVLRTNENVLQNTADVLHNNENIIQTSADILQADPIRLDTSPNILDDQNVLQNNRDLLHKNPNLQTCGAALHSNDTILHNSPNVLQTNDHALRSSQDILCVNENVLQTSQDVLQSNEDVLTNQNVLQSNNDVRDDLVNDTLQEIFRDEDLSAVKESFILDRELKDWILNRSNDEKSEDGFSRSNSLIEPALLHVRDDEVKSQCIDQKVDLPTNDSHDDSSVLNFLDTLATECLSYPGTEIRTNNGDFQLDLFSFHS